MCLRMKLITIDKSSFRWNESKHWKCRNNFICRNRKEWSSGLVMINYMGWKHWFPLFVSRFLWWLLCRLCPFSSSRLIEGYKKITLRSVWPCSFVFLTFHSKLMQTANQSLGYIQPDREHQRNCIRISISFSLGVDQFRCLQFSFASKQHVRISALFEGLLWLILRSTVNFKFAKLWSIGWVSHISTYVCTNVSYKAIAGT